MPYIHPGRTPSFANGEFRTAKLPPLVMRPTPSPISLSLLERQSVQAPAAGEEGRVCIPAGRIQRRSVIWSSGRSANCVLQR